MRTYLSCDFLPQLVNIDALLDSSVTVTDGDSIIFESLEVDSHTIWRADFVLAAVAFADVAVVIPNNLPEFFFEHLVNFAGFFDKLRLVFKQRRDSGFDWREVLGQFQKHALFAVHLVFGVGCAEHSHEGALDAKTWLNHMRHERWRAVFGPVFHVFAAHPLNITEVEIGAVRETQKLFAANRKIKFEVDCTFAVVCAVVGGHFKLVHHTLRQTKRAGPLPYGLAPHFKRLFPIAGMHKIFDFHLLELTRSKDKITRADLVAERLALLRQTKRHIRIKAVNDIFVVREDALRGFRPQITLGIFIVCN